MEGLSNVRKAFPKGIFEKLEMKQNSRYISSNIEFVKLISPNGTVIRLEVKVKYWKSGMILDEKFLTRPLQGSCKKRCRLFNEDKIYFCKRNSKGVTVTAKQMDEDIKIDAKIVIGADGPPP